MPKKGRLSDSFEEVERGNYDTNNFYVHEYKKDDLASYESIVYHKILYKNYGLDQRNVPIHSTPILGKDGTYHALPIAWEYFLKSKKGSIIRISTEGANIGVVNVLDHIDNKIINDGEDIKQFVDILLKEAKSEENTFNKFKKKIRNYVVPNTYLTNHRKAEYLRELDIRESEKIQQKVLEPSAEDIHFEEGAGEHVDRWASVHDLLKVSAILHYFMAIEGFIGLIYKYYLREYYRKDEYIIAKTDLMRKLVLLPYYCYGFSNINIDPSIKIIEELKWLVNYRNSIIHSRIVQPQMMAMVFEKGYIYNLESEKDQKYPIMSNDVLDRVERIEEEIINFIMERMTPEEGDTLKKFIVNGQMGIISYKTDSNEYEFGLDMKPIKSYFDM